MNKIFKVIWSKSKECYVVVSEIANNYSAKKAVLTSVFAVLTVTGGAAHVMGATLPSELTDKGSIKIGQYATTSNMSSIVIGTSSQFRTSSVDGYRAIGIGSGIIASGNNSVSIGGHSRATEDQAIAIGGASDDSGAKATGSQSIAIGGNTVASGDSSIVVGGDDVEVAFARTVTYTDINTGQAKTGTLRQASIDLANIQLPQYITATASHAGTAIGMKTKAGDLGLSLGMGADSATRLDGKAGNVVNAIAIGAGAKANRDNSIAIGGGANTDAAGVAQTSYTMSNGDTVNWAGGENVLPGDVVSFGAPGYERQLKNVAPGIVSATSTDAVNGSQLYAIAEKTLSKYISIKSDLAGNKSNKGAEATDSMAIGPDASTTTAATKGTALGTGATVTVANGVAVGSQSKASIASGVAGYNVNDSRTDKYGALSGKALTSTLGAFAVGNETNTRQITGVAAGTADTDAVNVAQLKSVNLKVAGDTGTGDVNLANSTLNIKGAGLAKTTASGKDVTVTVSEKAVKQEAVKAVTMAAADPNGAITVTPELSADKDTATYKVGIDPTKVAETTNLTYKDNDGADKTVTLKKGLNFKNGTMTTATTAADGVVTVDINDDTKAKINNAATNKLDNLTSDGEQKVKSLSAWKVKANNSNAETVTGGDTVTFNDGSNIAITQNGKTFTVATKNDVNFNTVTATTKVTTPAVEGLTNTSWTPGTTTPVSGRAATEDQLKAVDTQVATNKDDIATNKANIDKNKDNIAKNADNITKNATEIATNKGNIATNTAALARKISLGGNTGSTTEKSLSTGDVKFNVKGAGLVTTSAAGDDVTVTVTEKAVKQEAVKAVTMAAADPNGPVTVTPELSADKDTATYKVGIDPTKVAETTNLTYKDNDGADKTVTLKKGLNFKNGTMTTATTDADGVVTVDINDDTKAKINNAATNKLDNLTPDGEQKVKSLSAWKVKANNSNAETVTGGDTVTFNDGSNIAITQNGKTFTVATKDDVTFNSVTAGSKVTAPAVEGLTNTSWTPGTTTPVSGRAATEDQLKAVDTQVATNKDDIATNKANIDKNKDNIAKNADNITKNATEIATNKGNIAINTQNIATNTAALARKISLGGDTGNTTEKSLSTGDVKFNVKGAGLVTTSAAGDDVTVTVTEKAVKQEAVKAVTMAAADPNGPITVTPELSADKDTATYKIGIDPTKIAESTILTYKDNDGTDKTVTLKKGLNFKNGTMTTATTTADGVVTVDINDDTKAKINNAATNKLDNLTPEGEQKVKTLATWNVATAADGGTHSGDSTSTVTGSDTVTFKAGNNLNVNQTGRDIIFSLNKEISDMTSLGLTNPDGAKATIKTGKGDAHVGETDQADRIVYTNAAGTEEQVATLKDGLQFGGDNNPEVINKTLNQKLEVVGGADAAKLSDNNIGVNAKDGKLHVQLSKELNNLTSAQFKNGNAVSTISSAGTTVTDGTNTTQYGPKGITINPGANEISLTDKGLNNGGKVISNVASGGNVDTNAANIGDVKKATAASKTTVSVNKKDTETPNLVLEATVDPADGHTNYDIKLANKVNLGNGNIVLDGTDGSIKAKGNITSEGTVEGKDLKAGDVTVNKDNKGTVNGLSNKTWTRGQAPVSGQAATEDQIQAVDTRVMAVEDKVADFGWMAKSSAIGTGQATGNNAATKVGDKTEVEFRAGDNLTIDQTGTTFTYSLNKNMTGLESVSVGDVANDKPGVVLNGADGTMGVRGKDGANASITAAKGADGLIGTGTGKDRIVYETKDANGNPVKETVATMNDGLHFAGDNGNTVIDKTLNEKLEIVGGADAAKLTDNNIGVNAKDGKLQVQLAKDLNGLSSVEVKDDNGGSTVMKGDTIKSKDAAGNTSVVNGSGVTITPANPQNPNAGTVSLTTEGLNNGNNQIKGVAAGTADTDAVNLGQLKKSNAQLANAIANVESETQQVGAHAAAMSALKPIQYDPLEPTQVMAGYGNYRGKSAAALGLAHYTNEDTMFNVGVSVGGRHNMINAGYTHKFGNSDAKKAVPERYKGGPISSIYVMQDEMTSLKQENSRQKEVLDKQQAEIESLKAMVNSLLATKG
ncbi:MAG: ESPR-type extended signal peptide-containing protein [Veillonella parvula]|uniref:YadA-like family protein n=1 Tax=Veillonella parvula TaxID=29466 RepID=UPI0029125A37|nr:YadA-like family protein [Veillonella parvula]MDU4430469.1 ESPR-type extended signal peptide-containing protein [Veillonella parvula]MDU7465130.1 ESPR-type extended signal peptide-containing protein [Veillonella parvula]